MTFTNKQTRISILDLNKKKITFKTKQKKNNYLKNYLFEMLAKMNIVLPKI